MAAGRRSSSVLRRLGLAFEAVRDRLEVGGGPAAVGGQGDTAVCGRKRGRGCKGCAGAAPRRRAGCERRGDGVSGREDSDDALLEPASDEDGVPRH